MVSRLLHTVDMEIKSVLKAFAYLRVSSTEQGDGDGFERQRVAIATYADRHDISITETFHEELTGKTEMEHRAAFMAMIDALEANGVKTVIVEKLDRLARDLMVQESIITDFQTRGYTIISTHEPDLCSNDPSRVLMRQIIGAFSQYERALIVMRTKSARDRIRARGERCEGKKPYGTRGDESRWVEHMVNLRSLGKSYDAIAEELNTMNVATRHGKRWYGCTVGNILQAQGE